MMQTTLIILKPDAVQRGLIGRIIERFEGKGLQVVGAKMLRVTDALAEKHYGEHKGKPFYPELIKFITSAPVMLLAIHGREAIAVSRRLIGATDGLKAEPGTIRGDWGLSGSRNLVHGSDSPTSAERELKVWFAPGEVLEWERTEQDWIGTER